MYPSSEYRSYLLRLWTATHDGEAVWRASLQSTATGQREGFPDLESLLAFLQGQGGDEDKEMIRHSTIKGD